MPLLQTAIVSYLLGSIPFGYLLVRLLHKRDIRETGSGNIGATNVARTSPALGAATLVLDALKGFTAAALARHFHPDAPALFMAVAALFAIVGHMFPIWLRLRGGKGVATALGAFLCVAPESVLVMLAIFVILVAATRYISLGSIVAAMCFPLLVWKLERLDRWPILLVSIACALIIIRHHENIGRLVNGTENPLQLRRR